MCLLQTIKIWCLMIFRAALLLFSKKARDKFKLQFDAMSFVLDVVTDNNENVVIRYEHRWPRMIEETWRLQVTEYLKGTKTFDKFNFHGPDYLDPEWMFAAHKKAT